MTWASEYIDALPSALASFPECQSRREAFASTLALVETSQVDPRLADALAEHRAPGRPGETGWWPEVLTAAVVLALREQMGDDRLLDHVYNANLEV